MLRRLFCALIIDRSSSFQLDGAPDNASTVACVGIWRYGVFVPFVSTGACFASLILEKMDILITIFGDLRNELVGQSFLAVKYTRELLQRGKFWLTWFIYFI